MIEVTVPETDEVVKTRYPVAGMVTLLRVASTPVVVLVTAAGAVVTLVREVMSVPYPML